MILQASRVGDDEMCSALEVAMMKGLNRSVVIVILLFCCLPVITILPPPFALIKTLTPFWNPLQGWK